MDASKLNAEELFYYEMDDSEREFVDELKESVEKKAIKLGLINKDDSKEDKAEVLAGLYNNSHPSGLCEVQID